MFKAAYAPYTLNFLFEARTSRETMHCKPTYFVKVWAEDSPEVYGIGECALFRGLSCDDTPDYEQRLLETCRNINSVDSESLRNMPSILFGVETAILDLKNGGKRIPFNTPWNNGETSISINGLVWMGSVELMRERIEQKLSEGFRCIKFKIGGEDFEQEFGLLKALRDRFTPEELEIRLDANGAFTPQNALERLNRLSQLTIHSLEQPIKAGQWSELKRICAQSPIPIALDEELIGVNAPADKFRMLQEIKPQYIILKPALCGSFSGASEWISMAQLLDIGWWATSALESNIGLNAIGEWVSTLGVTIPQGLGTGGLYSNNIKSPLYCKGPHLFHDASNHWIIPKLDWKS